MRILRLLLGLTLGLTICGTATAQAADPIVAAAGDIACARGQAATATKCAQKRTSDLVPPADVVLALGDNQYSSGSYPNYTASYAPTWGLFFSITNPIPGNHEYGASGAAGYFQYFGARAGAKGKGWYSFEIGAWHVIAINSECNRLSGACRVGGAQESFVRADLAAHPNACTLAYWHEPRFSSGAAAVTHAAAMAPIWNDLYDANADLVLSAHKHAYERFAPLNKSGAVDSVRGMREIIAGTGGEDHAGGARKITGSEVRNNSTFGALKLTLHPTGYDWRFMPEPGKTFTDSGSTACH